MKKIIAGLLAIILTSLNSCFAFSEMYYFKNVNVNNVKSIVSAGFNSYEYKLIKSDPYYGTSLNNPSDYAVVILQQNGTDGFYYYQSNNNTKINKAILKKVKKNGITYEEYQNSKVLATYDRLANDIITGKTNQNRYTFEEPVQVTPLMTISGGGVNGTSGNNVVAPSNNTLRGGVAKLESGTKFDIYLQTSINTATANKGDQVIAVLMKDVVYNNTIVFPQGSIIYGTLTKATHASYGSRNGKVVIEFNQIVTPENKTYQISTEKINFSVTNDGKVSSVVSSAAVGAVVGALGGLLYAAISGGNIGTAAAIGAGVGAGTGLAGATIERGVDAEIPSFTEMELVLTKSVSVTVNY